MDHKARNGSSAVIAWRIRASDASEPARSTATNRSSIAGK